ncbi:hypothetical protein EON63_08675 [archaeon]|nr:MAG: hypothetical protein EON63_08675 [archaeon]
MRSNIARLLRTEEGRVGLKARTHEEVDSVGQQRAYECHVILLLERVAEQRGLRGERDGC